MTGSDNLIVDFAKMNGLGNKIIVADLRGSGVDMTPKAAINLASHRETHFDQIMEIRDPSTDGTDAYIRIWNSDGSEAGACGNGMRCVVSALVDDMGKSDFLFETKAGVLFARELDDARISVDMGAPALEWDQIPLAEEFADTRGIELQIGPIDDPVLHTPSAVSMGNPHAIFWVKKDVWSYDLHLFGPVLENHPIFPDRANISIAQVMADDHVIIRTWERGAGITEACGSAACATLVSSARLNKTGRQATITVPGGDLHVAWNENNRVTMTGPAAYEWSGKLDPKTGDWMRVGEEPS